MSAIISVVTPIKINTAQLPKAGSIEAKGGESFVVTDPGSGSDSPVIIDASSSAGFELASGKAGAKIVVEGEGTGNISIGKAQDANGSLLDSSGSQYHIDEEYEGDVTVDLEGSIVGTSKVDLDSDTGTGSGSIAENAPGDAKDIDIYVETGAGDDQVNGTRGADFIRLGAGDDKFNAGAGDDIVRVGTGDDIGTLGKGNDRLYLTIDQMQGESTNTIKDFDSNGDDKIQIEESLEGLTEITGLGSKEIRIILSGAQTGTTTIISEGDTIDDDDIEFV